MNFLKKCRSHKLKIILAVSFLCGLFHRISISKLSLADSELEKCPACYGTNICPAFESGDIQFTGFTSWRFFQFFNVKNVFFGFWGSKNISIVIKKLGYYSELENLDRNLCKLVNKMEGCNIEKAMETLVESLNVDSRSDTMNISSLRMLLSRITCTQDWLSCADQDLLDFILRRSLLHSAKPSIENILTLLLINQEPLMAMAFTPEMDYPFPRYYGACG